jgi:hypothetical protein
MDDFFEDLDSAARKARQTVKRTRVRDCTLGSIFVFLLALVILSALFSYRDIPHHISMLQSRWKNSQDNGLGKDLCRLRKEPIVLVKAQHSVDVVFELSCSAQPTINCWRRNFGDVEYMLMDEPPGVMGKSVDDRHYSWRFSIGIVPQLLSF